MLKAIVGTAFFSAEQTQLVLFCISHKCAFKELCWCQRRVCYPAFGSMKRQSVQEARRCEERYDALFDRRKHLKREGGLAGVRQVKKVAYI